jgi:hypothetical protein
VCYADGTRRVLVSGATTRFKLRGGSAIVIRHDARPILFIILFIILFMSWADANFHSQLLRPTLALAVNTLLPGLHNFWVNNAIHLSALPAAWYCIKQQFLFR